MGLIGQRSKFYANSLAVPQRKPRKNASAVKSFPFICNESKKGYSRKNNIDADLEKFFLDLNDLRYEVSQIAKKELTESSDLLKNYENFVLKGCSKTKEEILQICEEKVLKKYGNDIYEKNEEFSKKLQSKYEEKLKNDFYARLRKEAKNAIEKNPRFSHLSTGTVPYIICYDLGAKLKSFLELSKKDDIRDIFSLWQDSDEESSELDFDICNQIFSIDLKQKSFSLNDFKNFSIEKAIDLLGGRVNFSNLNFSKKPGNDIEILSDEGIIEINLLVSKINKFVGQYNGQLVNKIIKEINLEEKTSLKNKNELLKWLRASCPKHKLYKYNSMIKTIERLKKIKNKTGFPTFHPSSYYYETDKRNILVDLKYYENLKDILINLPFDSDVFFNFLKGKNESIKDHLNNLNEIQKNKIAQLLKEKRNFKTDSGIKYISSMKRMIRHFYFLISENLSNYDALKKTLEKELQILECNLKALANNPKKTSGFYSELSELVKRILWVIFYSRSFSSEFEKEKMILAITECTGSLSMQALKSNHKQFSIFFSNFQSNGILVFRSQKNGRLEFAIRAYSSKDKSSPKQELICYQYKANAKNYFKWEPVKLTESELLVFPFYFSDRFGKKYLLNNYLSPLKKSLIHSKLGPPNFIMTFNGAGNKVILRGTLTIEKKQELNNDRPKESKDKFFKGILNDVRYVVGIDRGEKKLMCYSVLDIKEGRVLEQGEFGGGFKKDLDNLYQGKKDAQKSKNTREIRSESKKIRGFVDQAIDSSIEQMSKLIYSYVNRASQNSEYVCCIFENLSSRFGRDGSYMELRQMNKLIKKITEDSSFYDMGVEIQQIHPAWTSQVCSKCGTIDPASRHGERYLCQNPSCAYEDDADIQASLSIALKWLQVVYAKSKLNADFSERYKVGPKKQVFTEFVKDEIWRNLTP